MRLLYLNRSVVLTLAAIATSTACGGDFHVTGGHKGLSGTGAKSGAGATSADGGPSSGGTDGDGAASGGSGNGARGGNPGSGGKNGSGGNTSLGGADAGGDGGAGTGGSGNGGSAGNGNGGAASGGTGGRTGSGGTTSTGGAAGAGGVNHSQFVKDYNRKCVYDSECTLVYQGNDVCVCDAQCPNASIATSALNQWNADRQALMCVALPCSKQNCQSLVASCGSSLCYARRPLIIDASHYDQTCLSAADCTTIPTGEVCSPCQCSKGAVSNKGYQDYLKDKQDVQCSPGPVACDCAPPPNQTLTCVLSISGSGVGKCTLAAAATTN